MLQPAHVLHLLYPLADFKGAVEGLERFIKRITKKFPNSSDRKFISFHRIVKPVAQHVPELGAEYPGYRRTAFVLYMKFFDELLWFGGFSLQVEMLQDIFCDL